MPEKAVFTPKGLLLEPAEYGNLCRSLVAAGIEEIRITGGEPTVRPEFTKILEALGDLPVRRKGITSNGQLLERHLGFLQDHGWSHLNISLDSLDPGRFDSITGGGDFRTVMGCIEKASAMGFKVKVNTVVMQGVNEDELTDFTVWSARSGIEVRFLEYMRIGPQLNRHAQRFMSADEMLSRLMLDFEVQSVAAEYDSTAILYKTASGAKLGFIASESKAFCGTCSRLRLSATGVLRACVMSPGGISIRHAEAPELAGILEKVMTMKPILHPEHNPQPMYALGG
jgi:cyclic pyranopterin phosphate synthase